MESVIKGKAYVLGDNIDTDQIIPAKYLMYNPAIPEERRMFGRYALDGVPTEGAGLPDGHVPFVDQTDSENTSGEYRVIIGGKNFGCGSSREHARWPWPRPVSSPSWRNPMPESFSGTVSTADTWFRVRVSSGFAGRSGRETRSSFA